MTVPGTPVGGRWISGRKTGRRAIPSSFGDDIRAGAAGGTPSSSLTTANRRQRGAVTVAR